MFNITTNRYHVKRIHIYDYPPVIKPFRMALMTLVKEEGHTGIGNKFPGMNQAKLMKSPTKA